MPPRAAAKTSQSRRARRTGQRSKRSSVSPAASVILPEVDRPGNHARDREVGARLEVAAPHRRHEVGGYVLLVKERVRPPLGAVAEEQRHPSVDRDAVVRLALLVEDLREPVVHQGLRLLRGDHGGVERGVGRVPPGRPLEDLLDQPALVKAVVDPVRAQVVLHPDVGRVPGLHGPGPRAEGLGQPDDGHCGPCVSGHGCHR